MIGILRIQLLAVESILLNGLVRDVDILGHQWVLL